MNAEAAPRSAKKKQQRLIWGIVGGIALLLLVIAVALVWYLKPSHTTTNVGQTETVATSDLTVTVAGDGTTAAKSTTNVNSQISGAVSKVYVKSGQRVSKGDELFKVSNSSLQSSLSQARANLKQSEQSVNQAEQQQTQAEQSVSQAKAQVLQAEQALSKAKSDPKSTSTDIKIAKQNVTSANIGLEAAYEGVDSASSGVSSSQANLESAQINYDEAVSDSADTVVVAPSDGLITEVNVVKGANVSGSGTTSTSGGSGGSGSSASSGVTGVSNTSSSGSSSSGDIVLVDDSKYVVEVSVNEVDAPNVKVGQKAGITMDSISNWEATGTVTWVSPTATTSNNVVSYAVDISIPKAPKGIKIGMSASASILTNVYKDVVTVPNTAIKVNGTTRYVQVVNQDGSITKQTVTVGASNDERSQILKGLEAGQVISLAASTGSSSSSSDQGGPGGMGAIMGGGGPPSGGRPNSSGSSSRGGN